MPRDDDRRYDRSVWGNLIAIGLMLLAVLYLIGRSVYIEVTSPW